jgi:hypothetical protein
MALRGIAKVRVVCLPHALAQYGAGTLHAGRHRLRGTVRQGRARSGGRVAGGVAARPDAPVGFCSDIRGSQFAVVVVKVGLYYVPASGNPAAAWVPAFRGEANRVGMTAGDGTLLSAQNLFVTASSAPVPPPSLNRRQRRGIPAPSHLHRALAKGKTGARSRMPSGHRAA